MRGKKKKTHRLLCFTRYETPILKPLKRYKFTTIQACYIKLEKNDLKKKIKCHKK